MNVNVLISFDVINEKREESTLEMPYQKDFPIPRKGEIVYYSDNYNGVDYALEAKVEYVIYNLSPDPSIRIVTRSTKAQEGYEFEAF